MSYVEIANMLIPASASGEVNPARIPVSEKSSVPATCNPRHDSSILPSNDSGTHRLSIVTDNSSAVRVIDRKPSASKAHTGIVSGTGTCTTDRSSGNTFRVNAFIGFIPFVLHKYMIQNDCRTMKLFCSSISNIVQGSIFVFKE